VCVRFVALGLEGAEGVPVGTSRCPEGEGLEGAEGVPAGTSRCPEGEGREDGVQSVPAAEGFMKSPG
jgi:hypothetical protein